nr:hypothetical protein [Nocardia crassostreae]
MAADEPFTVDGGVAGVRVAAEKHAGAGEFVEIAEDHGLHGHRGAEGVGDAAVAAVGFGAGGIPGAEDRFDGFAELGPRVERDRAVRVGQYGLAVLVCEPLASVVGVGRVSRLVGEGTLDRVGHAEVEDGVHHAGHADRRARADRHQQRTLSGSEPTAGPGFDHGDAGADLVPDLVGDPAVPRVVGPRVGGDHEGGWHRQAERPHVIDAPRLAADLIPREFTPAVEFDNAHGNGPLHQLGSRSHVTPSMSWIHQHSSGRRLAARWAMPRAGLRARANQ